MLSVRNTPIDPTIAEVRFSCDLAQCKGACCTMPGPKGAPITEEESRQIEKAFPVIKKYLNEDHLRVIGEFGLVEHSMGGITTPCFEHRACVFVTYEKGIAKCSFETAYFKNEIRWRKPLSCHLFPIRVDHGFTNYLRFETIPECSPALKRGNAEDSYLSDFLKDSLVRLHGEAWYSEFQKACASHRTEFLISAAK
jgi:hypothetical protein